MRFSRKGIQSLLDALESVPKAKVGVLGSTDARAGDGSSPDNATIGAKHEFGEDGMPIRSWLRQPLSEKFPGALESSGAFTPEAFKDCIKQKSMLPYVEKMAVVAVATIQEAFDTGGFGRWKPSKMAGKKVKQTLVETQQLKRSVTWEIE